MNNSRDRKSALAWIRFKKEIFPLTTDTDYSGKEVSEEQIAGTMTPNQFFNWMKGEKPADLVVIDQR